jgi:hypothetical protein
MRTKPTCSIGVALALGAGACSSSATVVDTPPGVTQVAHVGATLDLTTQSGSHIGVTLVQVADPAHGVDGASPGSGRRFVATVFRVLNAVQPVSGNLNAEVRLVGSDSNDHAPTSSPLVECAGDLTGHFQLAPGGSATGCAAFEVSRSVRVEKVHFFPAARSANNYGEWLVP